jgi:hypothetical protein
MLQSFGAGIRDEDGAAAARHGTGGDLHAGDAQKLDLAGSSPTIVP